MTNSKKIRLCLVEDEIIYGDLLQEELEGNDQITFVRHYTSAIEASTGLPNDKPDVVLMDIDLKEEITGIHCIAKVKDQLPNTHFIMFTVFGDNDNLFEALKVGAGGYVLKSDFQKIISAVMDITAGGAPMSREIARKVIASFRNQNTKLLSRLTPREMEVLEKISQGFLNKEIADVLSITEGGVKQHLHRIYKKLHVNNRVEATQKYWGK